MRDRSASFALLGIAAVAVTRFICRSHYLYDLDSVNFALAMARFDPSAHQPHPPGYFLYVCLGRLVNHWLPDPNAALVAIGIAASCGAAWMIYLLTRLWYGQRAAWLSILLFLASPLCWFHGIVALTYIMEAFFSALIGYLCWRTYTGERAFAVPAAIVFALAAGFRPSSALLLAPLWLFAIWRVRGVRLWLAFAAVVGVTLAWFLPMIASAGGFQRYFDALTQLWRTVPGRRTTLSSPWLFVARIVTMAWIFVICFGTGSILAVWPGTKGDSSQVSRTSFVWAWMAPGTLFFALVFLNFVNSGYLLLLCPPVFALLAHRLSIFVWEGERRPLRWAAVAVGVVANCLFFLYAPLYCSYRSVRDFDRNLAELTQDFAHNLDPNTTLIVGFDAHFLGYRHAGYYLPRFVTVQYPDVSYPGGKRVFAMHDRNTTVVPHLPVGGFERFAFFPLPEDPEYVSYVDTVISRLPPGSLSAATLGRRKVWVGPVSLLPVLFPSTTR